MAGLHPKTRQLVTLALDTGASIDEARTAALVALRRLADEGKIEGFGRAAAAPPPRAPGQWPALWCSAVETWGTRGSFRLCLDAAAAGALLCPHHGRLVGAAPLTLASAVDWYAVECMNCRHGWESPKRPIAFGALGSTLKTHGACKTWLRLWPWRSAVVANGILCAYPTRSQFA